MKPKIRKLVKAVLYGVKVRLFASDLTTPEFNCLGIRPVDH